MPYRTLGWVIVVVGIVGLAAVLALRICGCDIRRAAETGPRWRRVLLRSAITLLIAAGFLQGGSLTGCCYLPMDSFSREDIHLENYTPQIRKSMEVLSRRVDLLEKISAGEKLDPAVVKKTVEDVDYHLSVLKSGYYLDQLSGEDRKKAQELAARVQKLMDKYAKVHRQGQ